MYHIEIKNLDREITCDVRSLDEVFNVIELASYRFQTFEYSIYDLSCVAFTDIPFERGKFIGKGWINK